MARTAVACLGLAGTLGRPEGVRVLTYHRFGQGSRMPFTVSPEAFEWEMAHLARTGRAVSLADVEAHALGRRRLADGSVLVSIDDGDPSVHRVALPILMRHRIPAVVYALGGRPDGFEVMTQRELRDVADNGIAIGSHSVSHRSLARIDPVSARWEAEDSRHRLEDAIGRPVHSFAYPFGTRADVSQRAADILAEAGYRTAFTSLHGALPGTGQPGNPLLLPRVKVESGDPRWLFPRLCEGAMDGWRRIDEGLSAWQRPQSPATERRAAPRVT